MRPNAGVVQRRLSNGIRINFMHSNNEPQAAMLRMVAPGGRAREGQGAGPSGTGVISVGVRTLSESGTVGPWRRDQVELFCISKLINCLLDADEEFVFMDCHFAVGVPLPMLLNLFWRQIVCLLDRVPTLSFVLWTATSVLVCMPVSVWMRSCAELGVCTERGVVDAGEVFVFMGCPL